MAIHDYVKPALFDNDDDEDDDGPAIFKRSSSSSKQNQNGSSSKKLSSNKHEELRGSPAPNTNSLNRESSSSQKNKVISSVKSSTQKSSSVTSSSRPSVPLNRESSGSQKSKVISSMKSSTQKSSSVTSNSRPSSVTSNSRPSVPSQLQQSSKNGVTSGSTKSPQMSKSSAKVESSDDSDDDKPLNARFSSPSGVQKSISTKPQPVVKHSSELKAEAEAAKKKILDSLKKEVSDDSDDDVPLSCRFPSSAAAVPKNNLSGTTKVNESPMPSSTAQKNKAAVKDSSDDSEDEKPLFSRFKAKHTAEEKPLASKNKANGSSKKEANSDLKPPKASNKRAFDDANNSIDSLSKKAKVSDASGSGIVKKEAFVKKEKREDDNDHIPIAQRTKNAVSSSSQTSMKNVIKKTVTSFKKDGKNKNTMKNSKFSKSLKVPPGSGGGQKWTTLEHNGVIFPPPYKPHGVKILYNGQPVDLTPEQEEVATMFGVMKDTDYASKPKFIENFWTDWRQILGKSHVIKKFELCDFTPIYEWHQREKEKKKQMSSEEKKALKEEKLKLEEKYMWAIVDGVKEKVGNFRVEPPGLFRGRGEHPKMGKLKRRIRPRDITINIGKGVPVPECPIPGERWKEVKHDNSVTWLAFWNDPINPREFKYVFLAASSSLKGQSDKEKYEKARLLKDYIHGIRATYTKDFTSKDPTKRQIAVATYLIDKLALRAGNEKDDDEADTVGCCTLKVENVVCVPPNKLQFDFLGKDSIRYFNTVEVELPVYKAIGEFQTAKKSDGKKKDGGDDLFDMLDTSKLNAHLKELMPGLTAKVFRTYNASITLDDMLNRETRDGTLPEKIAVYQSANKEVAIICNHQRSVSKSHDAQMSRLNEKIDELKAQREELKVDLSRARKGKPPLKDKEGRTKKNLSPDAIEKKLNQLDAKIEKMELDKNLKEDLKTVALGTSKINYLDPRISVAWCKRHEVPIEKIFNKSLLAKFAWAMDVDPSYRF